jgi:hypothetical protein
VPRRGRRVGASGWLPWCLRGCGFWRFEGGVVVGKRFLSSLGIRGNWLEGAFRGGRDANFGHFQPLAFLVVISRNCLLDCRRGSVLARRGQ